MIRLILAGIFGFVLLAGIAGIVWACGRRTSRVAGFVWGAMAGIGIVLGTAAGIYRLFFFPTQLEERGRQHQEAVISEWLS